MATRLYTGNTYTDKVGDVVAYTDGTSYKAAVTAGYPRGQCTWYCFGRSVEREPYRLSDHLGDAGQWVDGARAKGYSIVSSPKSHSVAVFPNHVVFVEQVSSGNVYYTEGNATGVDGTVKKKKTSEFATAYGKVKGYIDLTQKPIPNTGG